MKYLILLLFIFLSESSYSQSPFVEGSLGVNTLTSVKEEGYSESGLGLQLNAKGGFFLSDAYGGVDLNFSVINPEDSYFNKVEENSYGVVAGVSLAGISRVYFTLYPYSVCSHDQGDYKGSGIKLGGALYLPFLKEANVVFEFRSLEYDKKKIGSSYQKVPKLEVNSLSIGFGFFFGS